MERKNIIIILTLAFAIEVINLIPYQLLGIFRLLFMDAFNLDNSGVGQLQAAFGIVNMMMYIPGGYLADGCKRHRLMALALTIVAFCGMYLCTLPQSIMVLMFLWMVMAAAGNLLFWSAAVACIRQAGGESHGGIAFGLEQCGRGVIAMVLSNSMLMLVGSDSADSPAVRQFKFISILRVMVILAALAALQVFLFSNQGSTRKGPEMIDSRHETKRSRAYSIVMLAVIIATTYIGNVTTGYFAQFAHDVVGLSMETAGMLATVTFLMRGCASLVAGRAADECGKTKIVIILFLGMTVSYLCLAMTPISSMSSATLAIEISCASACVFGLTSIYFSLLDELSLSQEETGSIVGILSTAGFLPGDVLMGPLAGYLLDIHPGEKGFQLLMFFAAGCGLVGLLATFAFRFVTDSQDKAN
jgi:predicted MFS family arabinose efflux permease